MNVSITGESEDLLMWTVTSMLNWYTFIYNIFYFQICIRFFFGKFSASQNNILLQFLYTLKSRLLWRLPQFMKKREYWMWSRKGLQCVWGGMGLYCGKNQIMRAKQLKATHHMVLRRKTYEKACGMGFPYNTRKIWPFWTALVLFLSDICQYCIQKSMQCFLVQLRHFTAE